MSLPSFGAGTVTLPALTNAHDHLALNHYPRTRPRDRYASAHDWAADVNALLDTPPYRDLRAMSLRDRLFIGGLKNLLCGALTVLHHDPAHRMLFARDFPVRVVRRTTWAHSFGLEPPQAIARAHRRTPRGGLFHIHLAEGTDARASQEYRQLAAIGAADARTVLIHGVGLSADDIAHGAPRVRALAVCPTTNHYLLGAPPPTAAWTRAGGTIWLGSDSRLTADGDLLDEIAVVCPPGQPAVAALHGLRSMLMPGGAPADWIVLRQDAVMPIRRADLALVVRGGVPLIGDPDLMARHGRRGHVPALLDGREKRVDAGLARQVRRCALHESGFSLE